jgi:predicted metal-dependent enzyme (double-stranded beta helix superfamily)
MKKPSLPAAAGFVDDVRGLFASDLRGEPLWHKIKERMLPLLADPMLREASQSWPATVETAPTVRNLLFYEDPEYGFVLNATVRKPNLVTNVHDHGDKWTLYGLITGHETMHRFERIDCGDKDTGPAIIRKLGAHQMGPGDIDVVPPGSIHQEHAGDTQSIAFIVREARGGTFTQHHYDLETGAVTCNKGPGLIPMELNG